ncbi:MAG: discoidin domain-containing protein [Candidatus Sumerlaeota bacterium]|nr:discoidin domain-containing protein [Candidatus Sumerlaeota bacterium]
MNKKHLSLALLLLLMAARGAGGQTAPRFVAPVNQKELDERVSELRKQCEPFMRSLPKSLPARERTALPAEWKFTFEAKATPKTEGVPPAPAWQGADFDDARWEKTTVPEWRYRTRESDSAIDPSAIAHWAWKSTTDDTICWYLTTLRAKPAPAGKRLWLCFDGVDWEAQVWLNGELLGSHRVYYEPFRFDVTGKIKSENTLAVRVIDGRSYGEPMTYWAVFPDIRAADQRYTPDRARSIRGNLPIGYHAGTGFGIHRDVYLEQSGSVLAAEVFARNDLSDGQAHLKVELDSDAARAAEIKVELLPENFVGLAYEKTLRCELPKGASAQKMTIPMPDAKVWSPESPNLYRCRVTVKDSDAKDALFGCRSFSVVQRDKPTTTLLPVYSFKPVKARWLRIFGRGSDATEWNAISEVDCASILRGKENVSASKSGKGYPPEYALDGKPETQWAEQGRDEWIQFKLNDAIEFDRVTIGWFAADIRRWDFDLLISNDGKEWTKLAYEAVASAAAQKSGELPNGMLMLNGKPVYLRGTNVAGLNCYSYWGEREELLHTLLLLKAGNFNIVRNCQHVQFPEVREMFDRAGMMSEQDQGGGYRGSIDMGIRREQHIHTGTVLARQCYNNPGVVLLTFGNEHHFDTEPILRAALAEDAQRVFKPISGRFTHSGGKPLILPDELWKRVIDDGHPYSGWYGGQSAQTWKNCQLFTQSRMVTLGEFGAEGLDAYETMRDRYPPQMKPPAPDADTLWAASQVQKQDVRQITGFGRKPIALAEYIEASQNYQEAVLSDKVIGMRLSPRSIAGYFQFHFIDVVPAFWPKSIVSNDHRPKKAYYQMAQLNQPVVAVPQLTGARPDAMRLWIANDLSEPFPGATLRWTVSSEGKSLLEGEKKLDVPPLNAVASEQIDLSGVAAKHPSFDVTLSVADAQGRLISRYQRTVRSVPEELLEKKKPADTTQPDPFNKKKP